MFKHNYILMSGILACFLLIMTSCSSLQTNQNNTTSYDDVPVDIQHIQDANNIFSNLDVAYHFITSIGNSTFSTTNFSNNSTKSNLNLKFSSFNGVFSLFAIDAKENNTLNFRISANIEGKYMLILVDEEKSTILLNSVDNKEKLDISNKKIDIPILIGTSYLIMVGEQAMGDITSSKFKTNATVREYNAME